MLGQEDTRTIPVDQPVADVLLKIEERATAHRPRSDVYEDEPSSAIPCLRHTIEASDPTATVRQADLGWTRTARPRSQFYEWLSLGAARLSRKLIAGLAAAQIDLARMNSEGLGTVAFDVGTIVQAVEQGRWVKVTVSPELVKTRSEVFASSLFAPSGAHLTWLAIEEDKGDGED